MAQEQKQPKKSSEEAAPQEEVAPETDVAERKEALDDDIDAILDEIDEVLEIGRASCRERVSDTV